MFCDELFDKMYFQISMVEKKYYLAGLLLAPGIRIFILVVARQLLSQVTLTITLHSGLVPVLAKVFSYIVFVDLVIENDECLIHALRQYRNKQQYNYSEPQFRSILYNSKSKAREVCDPVFRHPKN